MSWDQIETRIGRNVEVEGGVVVVKSLGGLVFVWRSRVAFVGVECGARLSFSGEMASGVESAECRSPTLVCFASRDTAAKDGQEWWQETKGRVRGFGGRGEVFKPCEPTVKMSVASEGRGSARGGL